MPATVDHIVGHNACEACPAGMFGAHANATASGFVGTGGAAGGHAVVVETVTCMPCVKGTFTSEAGQLRCREHSHCHPGQRSSPSHAVRSPAAGLRASSPSSSLAVVLRGGRKTKVVMTREPPVSEAVGAASGARKCTSDRCSSAGGDACVGCDACVGGDACEGGAGEVGVGGEAGAGAVAAADALAWHVHTR